MKGWLGWSWVVLSAVAFAGQEVTAVPRRSTAADLTPKFERFVTGNGLVVLLSPDPQANQVVVDMSFAAGALYQPPGKGGLAHLVEHVFWSGPTPETDYRGLLEARGAVGFNALTTLDRLSFRVMVPPEELPLALWTNADRLGSLAATLTDDELRRNQRVVAQERWQRIDDAPYGGNQIAMMRTLFPEGHPLRAGVIGSRDDINGFSVEDVKKYQRTLLVPANGVLTLVGNFDPAVAKEWIDRTVGRLPPGKKAPPPPKMPEVTSDERVSVTEELGRRPLVTLAWTLDDPLTELAEALEFGALLLQIYTDGFVGMNVSAGYLPFNGGAVFAVQVMMPHAVDRAEAAGNAEVVYRYLARVVMPKEIVGATLLAWDRDLMERLENVETRATLLTEQEVKPKDGVYGFTPAERHWSLTPERVQLLASAALKGKRATIQSRPTRPLPEKLKLQP